jgi:hypothetical protein
MKIVYIGSKPNKADNVAKTGLVWTPGEVQEVADEKMAAKLLEHPTIWADASKPYSMHKPMALAPEPPEPKVMLHPDEPVSGFWDPITIPVPADIFARLQSKELVALFVTEADADAFAEFKASRKVAEQLTAPSPTDKAPASSMQKQVSGKR